MTLHTFFGDIHNHNALGYGLGSLERSIEIARSHLDFFAFTGHSSWHDMVAMEGGRERHWLDGFARLEEGWPKVQHLIADANRDQDFSAFLGFEWHSSRFGDQCVIFPDDHQPLCFADDVTGLRRFCAGKGALMIPHRLVYLFTVFHWITQGAYIPYILGDMMFKRLHGAAPKPICFVTHL